MAALVPSPTAVHAGPPSAIGNALVSWITMSPAFERSGLAVAVATPETPCSASVCAQLWVTRDGGASWSQAAAGGWGGGNPVVAVDGTGHESLYADNASSMVRSDDAGATWHAVGNQGMPSPASGYAQNGTVAVAGHSGDYVLTPARVRTVTGSGGTFLDQQFALAPSWPGDGAHGGGLLGVSDRSSGEPSVEHCDVNLTCTRPTTLPGAVASVPALALSSTFDSDGVGFVQTSRTVYKTHNAGTTFAPLPIPSSPGVSTTTTMIALAPGYSEAGPVRTLFVATASVDLSNGTSGGGVQRSDDGGTTWQTVGQGGPLDHGATAVVAAPGGRLLAGYLSGDSSGAAGLVCSADGSSWQATCPPLGGGGGGGATATPGGGGGGSGGTASPGGGGSAAPTPAGATPGGAATGSASAGGTGGPPASGTAGGRGLPANPAPAATATGGGGHGALVAAGIVAAVVVVAAAGALVIARRRRPIRKG